MVEVRKKALFIIDVQPNTLSGKALDLIPNVVEYIKRTEYDAYVEATYYADKSSMLFKQMKFFMPKEKSGGTSQEVLDVLGAKLAPRLSVTKNTRSCFQGANATELEKFIEKHDIKEAHFLGFDINDCVLASAYSAVDRGLFSYVIEDLCHHNSGLEGLKEAALLVLRRQHMTIMS